MATGSERRASPRQGVDHAVRLMVGEAVHPGRLTSLSRMGGLVVLDRAVAVGTPVALLLQPEDASETLTLRAQVVRVQPSQDAHALGLLFAPLAPAALALVNALIASH